MYSDGSITKDESGWGFTVKLGAVNTNREGSTVCTDITLGNGSRNIHTFLRGIASGSDRHNLHSHNNAIILTVGIAELAAESRTWNEEAQTGICIGFDI